ncbi:MAG: hypothetical protein GXO77_02885 [Calditrichaeota bacterium]|nr:hypothetical protein [Calditrichota bacterium]
MQSHRIFKQTIWVLSFYFFLGCAITHAPKGWLPDPSETRTNVYGGWTEIQYSPSAGKTIKMSGELIAIGKDSLFLANTSFHSIALSDIKSARLTAYNSKAGTMGLLVILGTASTVTNGFFLMFTAPLWLIGGSLAARSRSFDPILDYPKKPWGEFVPFARYPQGLPPDVDKKKIRIMFR